MPGAWLVLPTYNEAENLEPIVAAALPQLATASPDHTILVVDDNSPDGTGTAGPCRAAGAGTPAPGWASRAAISREASSAFGARSSRRSTSRGSAPTATASRSR